MDARFRGRDVDEVFRPSLGVSVASQRSEISAVPAAGRTLDCAVCRMSVKTGRGRRRDIGAAIHAI
jgi:hypothetical protein